MNKIIQNIKLAMTPGTAGIVKHITSLERTIEASIAKDMHNLKALRHAELAAAQARKATDTNVNAAYKLLHNLSELTK